jgi:hypothetical protein
MVLSLYARRVMIRTFQIGRSSNALDEQLEGGGGRNRPWRDVRAGAASALAAYFLPKAPLQGEAPGAGALARNASRALL